MAADRRSCGDSGGDDGGGGMGDHSEDDDDVDGGGDNVGEGSGVNSASVSNARRSDSSLTTSLATRAVAILHSLGRGGADANTGAGAGVGVVVGSGGMVSGGVVSGGGATRAPGGDFEHCLWRGVIVDSTAKPFLVWLGEGTER